MAVGLRVLVVEDCADTAESCCELLGLWGHAAAAVRDGESALPAALAFRPDAVLLDLCLPLLNGYQVAVRFRAAGLLEAVLIAVTGHGRECDRRASAAAGIDHHLVKPVPPDDLARLLASIYARRSHAGDRATNGDHRGGRGVVLDEPAVIGGASLGAAPRRPLVGVSAVAADAQTPDRVPPAVRGEPRG